MISSSPRDATFSLARARAKILTAHALADRHRRQADSLVDAILAAEACLLTCQQDGSASEQQAMIDAIRHLSSLMEGVQ